MPMAAGVTHASKWGDLCTRPITWAPYAPRISGVTYAPANSKVRWAYEERADFSPAVEAALTTTSNSLMQTTDRPSRIVDVVDVVVT